MDPLAERLRQQREHLGKTTRELAHETKIREPYIDALERGRYDVLPAVYVRSFIRTLASALEIPPSEVSRLMQETFDEESASSSRLPAYQPPPVKHREQQISFAGAVQAPRLTPLSLIIVGAFILAAGIWWFIIRDPEPISNTLSGDIVDVDAHQTGIAAGDSIILTAIASDTAWLSITMDNARTQQTLLFPDGEYRWSAMKSFVVSIGNSGSVQFLRNGSPLPIFGRSGEAVREVTITRTNVTASNTAYRPPIPVAAKIKPPVTQPLARPKAQIQKKPTASPTRKKIERDLITPAPPQPIRR